MSFRGTIQNGKVIISDPVALPDGTEVRVTPTRTRRAKPKRRAAGTARAPVKRAAKQGGTVYDTLRPFIGAFRGLPRDASANVDHYLYGAPKRP